MIEFSLLNIEKCQADECWNYCNITSPFARIYLILEGEASIYQVDHHFHLLPGNIYLIPAFTCNTYQCTKTFTHIYIHVLIEPDGDLALFGRDLKILSKPAGKLEVTLFERLLELHPNSGLTNYNPDTYNDCIIKKRPEFDYANYAKDLETKGILSQIVSRFVTPEKQNSKLPSGRFRALLQYINAHISDPITVSELAEQMCLSPDYFSKLFIKNMHCSPLEFIHRKRSEKAQLLLITTTLSNKEIAAQSGYENLSYFYRQFKKFMNMTPNEFRDIHRNI